MRGRPRKIKPPKEAKKIAGERRHEREKKTKSVTHVTAAEFVERHRFCVNVREVLKLAENDPEAAAIMQDNPRSHKAVCDHPEDGLCGTWISPENLQRVNDRLNHRVSKENNMAPDPILEQQEEEALDEIEESVGEEELDYTLSEDFIKEVQEEAVGKGKKKDTGEYVVSF